MWECNLIFSLTPRFSEELQRRWSFNTVNFIVKNKSITILNWMRWKLEIVLSHTKLCIKLAILVSTIQTKTRLVVLQNLNFPGARQHYTWRQAWFSQVTQVSTWALESFLLYDKMSYSQAYAQESKFSFRIFSSLRQRSFLFDTRFLYLCLCG